ncbi:MAG: PASTA domain-containing protein [Candidatus Eisenbacteria bacterium]|uniref:PASTA domain-containing protein n=1 Tax=Eiseniibacteriota bacterium TaxID=2212470 RepID=A0A956LYF8_UNCEI|nr:PASTA domain-containing protein [Candidatus Eisenbacteria bacterium]
MTDRGFFGAEARRRRPDRAPAADDGSTVVSGPADDPEGRPSPLRRATGRSGSAPRHPTKTNPTGGWFRRRGLQFLWWLVEAGAAVVVGVLLFDRVLMPAVVHHGQEVPVPDLRGMAVESARESAEDLGLSVLVSQGRFDPEVPPGSVVETSPGPGVAVKSGRQIFLTPSLGKESRVVPDLHGMSVRLATMKLQEVGLRVGATDQAASDVVPPGQILATNPPSGAPVPAAGDVALLVSRKKAPIPLWMPDLSGRSANETAAWLSSCGFQVRVEETSLPGDPGTVKEQDPLPGAPIWPGGLVRLTSVRDRDSFEIESERDRRRWRR